MVTKSEIQQLDTIARNLKYRADKELTESQYEEAANLYREILMHLTKSQAMLIIHREMVLSCRMNLIVSFIKQQLWYQVFPEVMQVLLFLNEVVHVDKNEVKIRPIRGRAHYFRGYAYYKTGSFIDAQTDYQEAMNLVPNDPQIQQDWQKLMIAMQKEQQVKEYLAKAMTAFQSTNYAAAISNCTEALATSRQIQKIALTGVIHGNLATIYSRAGYEVEAIEQYEKALDCSHQHEKEVVGSPKAKKSMLDRRFGLLSSFLTHMSNSKAINLKELLGVAEEAIKTISELSHVGKEKQYVDIHLMAGRTCIALGQFSTAEIYLLKAKNMEISISGNKKPSLMTLTCLCELYCETQDKEKLRESLTHAQQAYNDSQNVTSDVAIKLFRLQVTTWEQQQNNVRDHEIMELWKMYQEIKNNDFNELHDQLRVLALVSKYLLNQASANNTLQLPKLKIWDDIKQLQLQSTITSDTDLNLMLQLHFRYIEWLINIQDQQSLGFRHLIYLFTECHRLKYMEKLTPPIRKAMLYYIVEFDILKGNNEEIIHVRYKDWVNQGTQLLRQDIPDGIRLLIPWLLKMAQSAVPSGKLYEANEHLEEAEAILQPVVKKHPTTESQYNENKWFCETLVGLCVLKVKQGNYQAAKKYLHKINAFFPKERLEQLDPVRVILNNHTEETKRTTSSGASDNHSAQNNSTRNSKSTKHVGIQAINSNVPIHLLIPAIVVIIFAVVAAFFNGYEMAK